MSEPTTALAPAPPPAERSLLVDLAGAQGMDPQKFYLAVKTLCGCQGATDEHFAGLLMVAREFGLNPILRHLYLMPTKRGVSVVMGVDGYLVFLRRAEKDGLVVRHDCLEGWFLDPRFPPEQNKTRRGCKALLWFDGEPQPREHVEWFDECQRDTDPWKQMPSRMIRHKAMSQAVRRWLGLYVMDTDEAARISDVPQQVAAEVSDTTPAVPIPMLSRAVAPPPEVPQGNPETEQVGAAGPGPTSPASSGTDPKPTASPAEPSDFDAAESRRLDEELIAEQKRAEQGGLFDERP